VKVRVLEEAEAELCQAVLYYEAQRRGLGVEFQAQVASSIKAIGESPNRFGLYEGKPLSRPFRRALVKRFPYVVIFEVRDKEVLIVAVAHGSREPGYWESRATDEPSG
jgi:plasmid stabilization system protein ParE